MMAFILWRCLRCYAVFYPRNKEEVERLEANPCVVCRKGLVERCR